MRNFFFPKTNPIRFFENSLCTFLDNMISWFYIIKTHTKQNRGKRENTLKKIDILNLRSYIRTQVNMNKAQHLKEKAA